MALKSGKMLFPEEVEIECISIEPIIQLFHVFTGEMCDIIHKLAYVHYQLPRNTETEI